MKFRCEHLFTGIDLDGYEALYFDEEFNIAMCEAVKLERELIKRDLKDGKLTRIAKVAPDREIPGPAAKIIGANKIEYTEYMDYKWSSYKGTWRTEPGIMPDKIESAGTFGFEKKPNGVLRWVEGDVKVKIFGVGGVVERVIIADIEKSYDKASEFTKSWIAKKK